MSATLTSLPFPSPTLPSATFFPGLHPRLHDLHECAPKNYSVRKCWRKTKEGVKKKKSNKIEEQREESHFPPAIPSAGSIIAGIPVLG